MTDYKNVRDISGLNANSGADLTFGEPFGCLRDLTTHKYIGGIYNSMKSFRLWYVMHYWPFTKHLRDKVIDKSVLQGRAELYAWMKDQTQKRLNTETQRPDFMTEVLKHNGEKGAALTPTEIANNAVVLVTAGSETTASLLSGVTYCLLQNPEVLQKLKNEVRNRWQEYDDITLDEVNKAPYLLAVLQEGLRYFPPVPTGFERRVGKGGATVSGYHLPEGTGLSVSSLPLGRSELYFKDPQAFVPERWLDDPRFANDKKSIVQPFNVGPRNCLGKVSIVATLSSLFPLIWAAQFRYAKSKIQNLAYAEMRLILAKLMWSFDLELDTRSNKWMEECKVMTVWIKPPLWVQLREVIRN